MRPSRRPGRRLGASLLGPTLLLMGNTATMSVRVLQLRPGQRNTRLLMLMAVLVRMMMRKLRPRSVGHVLIGLIKTRALVTGTVGSVRHSTLHKAHQELIHQHHAEVVHQAHPHHRTKHRWSKKKVASLLNPRIPTTGV